MRKIAQLLVSAAFCAGAFAQTTPPAIQTLTQETTLPFTQIGITGDADIPSNVLDSIRGGALEIRQQVEWSQVAVGPPGTVGQLRIRHILVQPGAPNPTPPGMQNAVVEDYIVRVDDMIRTTDPASVTFIGTIDTLQANSPFAGRTGRPVIYSIAWQGTPRRFMHATLLIPGRLTTFGATSSGTLVLAGETPGGGPTGPGTGENRPPVVNIVGAPRLSTVQSEVTLDASGSTDPENQALTYSWRVVSGAANLINPNIATPRAQLAGNAGEYVFEVTVTDARGAQTKGTITVFYVGRF